MTPSEPDLRQLQSDAMAALNFVSASTLAVIHEFIAGGFPATAQKVAALYGNVYRWRTQVDYIRPAAAELAGAGYTDLSIHLAHHLADFDAALQTIAATHASTVRFDVLSTQVARDLPRQIAAYQAAAAAAVAGSRAVTYDIALKAWTENALNTCPHCQTLLPDRQIKYCPNRDCARPLSRP
jgi:hypothetical protein